MVTFLFDQTVQNRRVRTVSQIHFSIQGPVFGTCPKYIFPEAALCQSIAIKTSCNNNGRRSEGYPNCAVQESLEIRVIIVLYAHAQPKLPIIISTTTSKSEENHSRCT